MDVINIGDQVPPADGVLTSHISRLFVGIVNIVSACKSAHVWLEDGVWLYSSPYETVPEMYNTTVVSETTLPLSMMVEVLTNKKWNVSTDEGVVTVALPDIKAKVVTDD